MNNKQMAKGTNVTVYKIYNIYSGSFNTLQIILMKQDT